MKPQVLFELTKQGSPVAWIQRLAFTRRIKTKGRPKQFVTWVNCLIWKPELFEPKLTLKERSDGY